MTGSSASNRPSDDGSVARTVGAMAGSTLWTAVAATFVFLGIALATFVTVRVVVWDVLRADLNVAPGVDIIAVTPLDIFLLQGKIALLVAFVLALEAVVLFRSWPRSSLPRRIRPLLAVAGIALFPIGAILGYDLVFPVASEFLAAGDSAWSIVRWTGLACYVSIATGVAVQVAFTGCVLGFSRFGANG